MAEKSKAFPPENRSKTGKEATRFKPGVSGNPGGRPKTRPLTDALKKIFSNPNAADSVARAMFNKARQGSVQHFQEIANRLEGKVQSDDERATSGITVVIINRAFRPKRETKEIAGETITVKQE